MKYGIYYAFWEKQWGGEFRPYVKKVRDLGFDILEISCATLPQTPDSEMVELGQLAKEAGITLTAGYGPAPCYDLSSPDPSVVQNGLHFYRQVFAKMALADIHFVGGGLYSHWPVNFSKPIDKQADWQRSVNGVRQLADMAAGFDITLGMEVLNRFEGYLLTCAAEGVAYVKEVDRPNVKVMLDTFHMNIEEDSFTEAILTAGDTLGHFHIGECNRKLPGQGRIPWEEIGSALRQIGYDGNVVMEPFILSGGQVGQDIKVWRDISAGKSPAQIDHETAESVAYVRRVFEGR